MRPVKRRSRFHLHQKVKLMVNRYEVFADVDGGLGELVASVEQKR